MKYVLMYQPPCGTWYVHSHKLYDSEDAAEIAAKKFLPRGTVIAVVPCQTATIEHYASLVI